MAGRKSQQISQTSGFPLDTSIFIVGASVFGLSSAYHLAAAGYRNITVFDRAGSIPSPHAASHDLNKIIRAEYGVGHGKDDFYTELALVSLPSCHLVVLGLRVCLQSTKTPLRQSTGSSQRLVITRMVALLSQDRIHPHCTWRRAAGGD